MLGARERTLFARLGEFGTDGVGGYRQPLADGFYRVRLNLVESEASNAGGRSFDVLLARDVALAGYGRANFAGLRVAGGRDLAARVDGGLLEIAFRPRPGSTPAVTAGIEIAPIDDEQYRQLQRAGDDAPRAADAPREHGAVRINCGLGVDS